MNFVEDTVKTVQRPLQQESLEAMNQVIGNIKRPYIILRPRQAQHFTRAGSIEKIKHIILQTDHKATCIINVSSSYHTSIIATNAWFSASACSELEAVYDGYIAGASKNCRRISLIGSYGRWTEYK